MSHHGEGQIECAFSGHGDDLLNVKFFRGRRDDVITAEEINAEARNAVIQHKAGVATVSTTAPLSQHSTINVREFIAAL